MVVGASAGGVEALSTLVAGLTADFDAAMLIVMHVGASDRSCLSEILQKHSALPVSQAREEEPIRRGRIYVARPDYHLIVESTTLRLVRGPRENRSRPAIDALFRSAAYAHASRVVGVVLSGMLDDGSAGLWWVKERGGTAVVQELADAKFPAMPENALRHIDADHIAPVEDIGPLLMRLAKEPAGPRQGRITREFEIETLISKEGEALRAGVMNLGPITPYTCPECHGVLVQLKEGGTLRFRCHTGHAYSINTLLAELTEYVEGTLWNSIRAIEESAMLLEHLGRHAGRKPGSAGHAALFQEKARDTLRRALLLRKAAHQHQTLSRDNIAEVDPHRR